MKASELIAELQKLPPDTVVYVPGYENGLDDITKTELVQVKRDVQLTNWYFGDHEITEDGESGFVIGDSR